MAYLKLVAGTVYTYPYSIAQLRRDHPNVSFPLRPTDAVLAEWGVYPVAASPRPERDDTKNVAEGTPVLIDGVWTQVWTVTDATPQQLAEREALQARVVRTQRNELLRQSDWMALSDTTMPVSWAVYRQALRDVTTQVGFPYDVLWPVAPD